GLDHIAIECDLPFAQRGQIDYRPQAPSDEPLNLDSSSTLLARTCLAPRAFGRRPRQHAVFGGNPAAPLALEPGRQPLFQAGGHQHVGIAEFHKAGAFGILNHPTLQRNRTQLIHVSAARPHLPCSLILVAHHTHMADLNKTAPMVNSGLDSRSQTLATHDIPIGATHVSLAALNERSREIFRQIVESYLTTGEPVGSRNLSRLLPIALSPASVRNVMSDLEQLGLIYAPHTSAGRLPTELGLRF